MAKKQESANQRLVKRITRSVNHYVKGYATNPKTAVTYMLVDLRHYCDMNGLDFAELDRVAYVSYIENPADKVEK